MDRVGSDKVSRNRVTIREVADKAQVSQQTVSNVINGSGRMSEQTRLRVKAAIDSLGYHSNRSAQMLRTGHTKMLGITVPRFDQPFCSLFCDCVALCAHEHGYGLVVSVFGDDFNGTIKETYQLNADGWIFFADATILRGVKSLKQAYPVVLAGDYLGDGQLDTVMMPNVEASRYVTGWLMDHSDGRVGMIGASFDFYAQDSMDPQPIPARIAQTYDRNTDMRLHGYLQALKDHDNPVDWNLIRPVRKLTEAEGESAMEMLLREDNPPSAVFCANDALALGALSALSREHIRIPEQIQIIGFDNTRESRYSSPPLTTVDPFIMRYAQLAVEQLIARIEGYDGPAKVLDTDFQLVERNTTL